MSVNKKPFYDDSILDVTAPTTLDVHGRLPPAGNPLENQKVDHSIVKATDFPELISVISTSRKWVISRTNEIENTVNGWVQKYLHAERSFTETILSLKDDKEPIIPSALYILVAGMGGSIYARTHIWPVRFLAPPVFGTAAFAYLLPNTFHNTTSLLWKVEQNKAPKEVLDAHIATEKAIKDVASQTTRYANEGKSKLEQTIHSVRLYVADKTGVTLP